MDRLKFIPISGPEQFQMHRLQPDPISHRQSTGHIFKCIILWNEPSKVLSTNFKSDYREVTSSPGFSESSTRHIAIAKSSRESTELRSVTIRSQASLNQLRLKSRTSTE